MKKIILVALMVVWLSTLLVFNGCSSGAGEGFAIYLTKNDIPASQMEMLSNVAIADKPVISIDDIISYTGNTHEIELTPDAFKRVMALKVPTSGKVFMVCVDKAPIYWGAFWTPISSQSFNGVAIFVPPLPLDVFHPNTVRLERGYPTPAFAAGEDPRGNPLIMESLEKSGKLK